MPPCHVPAKLWPAGPPSILPIFLPFLPCLLFAPHGAECLLLGDTKMHKTKSLLSESSQTCGLDGNVLATFLAILSLQGHLLRDASRDPLSQVWCFLRALQETLGAPVLELAAPTSAVSPPPQPLTLKGTVTSGPPICPWFPAESWHRVGVGYGTLSFEMASVFIPDHTS